MGERRPDEARVCAIASDGVVAAADCGEEAILDDLPWQIRQGQGPLKDGVGGDGAVRVDALEVHPALAFETVPLFDQGIVEDLQALWMDAFAVGLGSIEWRHGEKGRRTHGQPNFLHCFFAVSLA